MKYGILVRPALYDNNLDAWIPERWALETIDVLEANMMAAMTVHRDFEQSFAAFGDTVNTRKPNSFTAENKHRGDDVTDQDATATNIPVKLNQHVHVSFTIDDQDDTLSFMELTEQYIKPAGIALADRIDKVVLGQVYQFLETQAGTFAGMTKENAVEGIVNTKKEMNKNLCPDDGLRFLAVGTNSAAAMRQAAVFHEADKAGSVEGLIRGSLGTKFNFNLWEGQNVSSLLGDVTTGLGEIDNASGYAAGTTVLTVDGFAADEVHPGQWVKINGHVYHVAATNNATATELTLEYGLKAAVADNDDIIVYDKATVDNASGYAVDWSKRIVIADVSGGSLQVGQMVTFRDVGGTVRNERYSVVATDGTTWMQLDRPLERALANNDIIDFGPVGGDYNFAYHRNALTLAIRPLKPVSPGRGALSAVRSNRGLTIRVTIGYDTKAQKTRVTLDFLAGIKILDSAKGAVLLG